MMSFNPNKKEFSGDGRDENRVKGREREYVMSLSHSQKGSSSSLSFELRVLSSLVFFALFGVGRWVGWSQWVWVGRRRRRRLVFFSSFILFLHFIYIFLFNSL